MAHYLISEASRKLSVEAHVLRYWEEELKLEIPRNELGHRYYTEKQLALFQKIKELKELGYQLKAIRTSLSQEEETEPRFTVLKGEEKEKAELPVPDFEGPKGLQASAEKMEQFQVIMTDVLAEAFRRNHESFSSEVSGQISTQVMKEMNYLMRDQEEKEEERYRKLDETIRACQRVQKQKSEAAATKVPDRRVKKKRFGWKRKA